MNRLARFPLLFFALLLLAASHNSEAAAPVITTNFTRIFDGQSLASWKVTDFAGGGEVAVKDGSISMQPGTALTGVTYTNNFPKVNYEIVVEARKVQGQDFFAAITFPVKDSHATFVQGGWGGSLVGLSSIDGADASENETTTFREFKEGVWHKFRVRVSEGRIQCWIDDDRVVNVITTERKISMRPGEIELSAPLGIASFRCESEIRKVEARTLAPGEPVIPTRKIALIAGKKSHGPGEHDYEAGLRFLQERIDSMKIEGVTTELHTNGWPANPAALNDAATVVLYCDGSDHNLQDHPLLVGDRLAQLEKIMEKGAGLVAIHYAVFVPNGKPGDKFLEWIGGYFDYQSGPAPRHWFSKIETKEFEVFSLTPSHPTAAGVRDFKLREEYYSNIRFPEAAPGWRPILSLSKDRQDRSQVVGWALERKNGGRGVGYTGGHFHANWQKPEVQKMIINSILWTAQAEVPPAY
ncbi:MAG TPA: DUF1080 domain-containing protein [Methylomirabilota bacterium]|nr:DUF1080 domain-containing protein [Methylomirabilota bacterium]